MIKKIINRFLVGGLFLLLLNIPFAEAFQFQLSGYGINPVSDRTVVVFLTGEAVSDTGKVKFFPLMVFLRGEPGWFDEPSRSHYETDPQKVKVGFLNDSLTAIFTLNISNNSLAVNDGPEIPLGNAMLAIFEDVNPKTASLGKMQLIQRGFRGEADAHGLVDIIKKDIPNFDQWVEGNFDGKLEKSIDVQYVK